MSFSVYLIFLGVSFIASAAGAVCGIGGGVVIKPVLDLTGVLSVAAVNFLSGCTVLSMACYSVIREKMSREPLIDMKTGTPLAAGAAAGGVIGRNAFLYISGFFAGSDLAGAVQAACLLVLTFGTFIYTINMPGISTRHVTDPFSCTLTGLALGVCSAFLGIGGGPINLVVLYYFFSMDTKTAAQNSLYIILFSQTASLLSTLVSGTIPKFPGGALILMIAGGISGGIFGRMVNKKIDDTEVSTLFKILLVFIMMICLFNICRIIMFYLQEKR